MVKRLLIALFVVALAATAFVAWSLDPPKDVEPRLEGSFTLAGVRLVEPGIRRSENTTLVVRDGVLSSVRTTTA